MRSGEKVGLTLIQTLLSLDRRRVGRKGAGPSLPVYWVTSSDILPRFLKSLLGEGLEEEGPGVEISFVRTPRVETVRVCLRSRPVVHWTVVSSSTPDRFPCLLVWVPLLLYLSLRSLPYPLLPCSSVCPSTSVPLSSLYMCLYVRLSRIPSTRFRLRLHIRTRY